VDELQLLIDLHSSQTRQGPGGTAETRKAIELAGIDPSQCLRILDVGCGTGASALLLAKRRNVHITAVDLFPEFLQVLQATDLAEDRTSRISPVAGSMDALPFPDEAFDVVWSEGAVYNMGFEKGVEQWRRLLKPGGVLAVSEITWLTRTRPAEIQAHWEREYPEIDTASSKIRILEEQGYCPVAYFVLPEHCWTQNYYRPLEAAFADFLDRNNQTDQAKAVVEAERNEIDLYNRYGAYYSYGFYIARKQDAPPPTNA